MKPQQIVEMDMDGGYYGDWLPSTEWRFHYDIMRTRPDAGAIIHTHSNFSTALACMHKEIPSFHYMIGVSGGKSIRCAKYATFGTQELSDNILKALKDRTACLIGNHGMICLGPNIDETLALAVEVETLAFQYWHVLQVGKPILLDENEMDRVLARFGTYGSRPTNSQVLRTQIWPYRRPFTGMAEDVGAIPVLETERLFLRSFRSADAEAAHAIYGNPEVMRYSISGPFETVESTAAHLAEHIRREAEHGYAFRAIVERESDWLIGVGGLVPMPPPWEAIEVGYRIRRDRWGEGFATEATLTWLDAGFRYFGLEQIVAVVEASNAASINVVRKCGMRVEGEADYRGVAVRKFVAYRSDWNPASLDRNAE